jgi:hypothetical protein
MGAGPESLKLINFLKLIALAAAGGGFSVVGVDLREGGLYLTAPRPAFRLEFFP